MMHLKSIFILVFLLTPILLFCELSSTTSFTIGGEYDHYFNLDTPINPDNVLDLPDWKTSFPIKNRINLYWDDFVSLNLDFKLLTGMVDSNVENVDEGYRFAQYQDNQLLKLNEFYITSSLGTSFLNINLGKLAPEFGVGYIRNPQSYFERITHNNSKWMVNPQFILNTLFFELFYAPYKDYIPDDYTDKDSLEESEDIVGLSANSYLGDFYLEVVGFYDDDFFLGLSSLVEVPMGFLLYSDVVFTDKHWIDRINGSGSDLEITKLDDPYFDILLGLNYTPMSLDWMFFLEGRYNQDGLTTKELAQMSEKVEIIKDFDALYPGFGSSYYGELASGLPFNSLSLLSLSLHIESFDYIFDLFKLKNTTFISFPFGIMNQVTVEFPLFETIKVNCSWNHIIDSGEYEYFLYKDSISFSINYNLYK